MRIHLIRHGQTHWNKEHRVQGQTESTLCAEGRAQAAALRQVLDQIAISKVYCSTSIRTRETAAILFADKDVETEYRDSLREILLGPWEGFLQTEVKEKYPESFSIDELRCIFCGMCEEACPVDAIELTSLLDLTGKSREEMIFDKEKLLSVYDMTKDAEPMKSKTLAAAGMATFGHAPADAAPAGGHH